MPRLFERRAQARVHAGGISREDALGGGLMVHGANRRIGLLVSRPEIGPPRLPATACGETVKSRENSGNRGMRSMRAFAFSLLRYYGERAWHKGRKIGTKRQDG